MWTGLDLDFSLIISSKTSTPFIGLSLLWLSLLISLLSLLADGVIVVEFKGVGVSVGVDSVGRLVEGDNFRRVSEGAKLEGDGMGGTG